MTQVYEWNAFQYYNCGTAFLETFAPYYNAGGNLKSQCSKRHSERLSPIHGDTHTSFEMIDNVPSNIPDSSFAARVYFFVEDNEAVIGNDY